MGNLGHVRNTNKAKKRTADEKLGDGGRETQAHRWRLRGKTNNNNNNHNHNNAQDKQSQQHASSRNHGGHRKEDSLTLALKLRISRPGGTLKNASSGPQTCRNSASFSVSQPQRSPTPLVLSSAVRSPDNPARHFTPAAAPRRWFLQIRVGRLSTPAPRERMHAWMDEFKPRFRSPPHTHARTHARTHAHAQQHERTASQPAIAASSSSSNGRCRWHTMMTRTTL